MDDHTRLPFGVLATAATLLSIVSCYATRIELWIPALREPIANWVNTHVQAAIIVATAAAAVVGLMLDRKHHRSITPFAVGCAGFVLIAWSMYAPFGRIDDIVGFVLLVSSVFLNQTKALHALTLTSNRRTPRSNANTNYSSSNPRSSPSGIGRFRSVLTINSRASIASAASNVSVRRNWRI